MFENLNSARDPKVVHLADAIDRMDFVSWATSSGLFIHEEVERLPNGQYKDPTAQLCWLAFRAGRGGKP